MQNVSNHEMEVTISDRLIILKTHKSFHARLGSSTQSAFLRERQEEIITDMQIFHLGDLNKIRF